MKDKVEAKLHGLAKLQNNDWVVKLVMSTEDYQKWGVGGDPMGTRYNLEISDADEDEYNAKYTDPTDKPCPNPTNGVGAEKSEGDKLRVRAVMLCKEENFQKFTQSDVLSPLSEQQSIGYLYRYCGINSRSELTTNKEAQARFGELDNKYKDYFAENKYKDNLDRE